MDIQLKRGLLGVCVLAAIKSEDSYGYKIIKDMKPYIALSESTLYTILNGWKRLTRSPSAPLNTVGESESIIISPTRDADALRILSTNGQKSCRYINS